jgi:hypothetical protein
MSKAEDLDRVLEEFQDMALLLSGTSSSSKPLSLITEKIRQF